MRAAAEQSTLVIEISASRSHAPKNDRRSWDVTINVSGGGNNTYPHDHILLEDPFTLSAYDAYEAWLRKKSRSSLRSQYASKSLYEASGWVNPSPLQRDDSIADSETASTSLHRTSTDARSADSRTDLDDALQQPGAPSIKAYRDELRQALRLDDHEFQSWKKIKIYIREDVHSKEHEDKDYSSIHSLMWELLEPYDTDTAAVERPGPKNTETTTLQQKIEVHRLFTGADNIKPLASGLRQPGAQIRLLLVIARGLEVDDENKFVDIRSVVLDTLCSVTKYLHSCGNQNRLQVDVVRPGTFKDLTTYLDRGNTYDLVHLDVHGRAVDSTDAPFLLFSRSEAPSNWLRSNNNKVSFTPEVFDFITAEALADELKKHNIAAVALSACLSSWAQGRPLSNMCRVFASRGVRVVTGMSFTVWSDKAEAYYAGFYPALVLANYGFRGAAVQGRLSLQRRLIEQHRSELKRRRIKHEEKERSQRQRQQQRWGGWRERRRPMEPEGEIAEQTYPTVTTYLSTKSFDRTDSAKLGVDLDAAFMGPSAFHAKGFWSRSYFLWASTVSLWLAKLPFLHWFLSPKFMTATDHLAIFETFCARPENARKIHSVGLMALEQRLLARDMLYIHIPASLARPQLPHDIRQSWLSTNFAGHVEIVRANWFKWCLLDSFLRLRLRLQPKLSWIRAQWQLLWKETIPEEAETAKADSHISNGKSRSNGANSTSPNGGPKIGDTDITIDHGGGGPITLKTAATHSVRSGPTVLIIDEIESIIKDGLPRYMNVVERMDRYITAVKQQAESGLYLVIMSTKDVGWSGSQLNADIYPWSMAEHFQAKAGLIAFYPKGR